MSIPINNEELEKLRLFVEFCSKNLTILNTEPLKFVKDFVEKLGGKVPEGEFNPAGRKCPFCGSNVKQEKPAANEPEDHSEPDEAAVSDTEFELELDNEGVIEGDTEPPQPMGDSSKTPTKEEIDKASEIRSQAAAAYGAQKYQEAIDQYTQAIELNPGNALFHAKRGQAYLKLKKPNACIRDCEKALELNCDSAAAYKFRGRAHRLLGNWEAAAKDLCQACKLDFDEEADEWLREVQPNAKKIEQHRIKQERKKAERLIKQREAALRKARKEQEKQKKREEEQQQSSGGGAGSGGFPGGFPGAGGLNFDDMIDKLKFPKFEAAFEDIIKNTANIGGFPGAGAFNPTEGEPKTEPKETPKAKPDFSDDGLD